MQEEPANRRDAIAHERLSVPWGEFADRELEQQYRLARFGHAKTQASGVSLFLGVLFAAFHVQDYAIFYTRAPEWLPTLLGLRLLILAAGLSSFYYCRRATRFIQLAWSFNALMAAGALFYGGLLYLFSTYGGTSLGLAGYLVFSGLIFLLFPLPLRHVVLPWLITCGSGMVIHMYFIETPAQTLVNSAFGMASLGLIASFASYRMQCLRRREFLALRRFHEMVGELQEEVAQRCVAESALRRHRDNLESLVEERTSALLESEKRLRRSQRIESVGQLAGGIAHDFNNLLVVILGSADLALSDCEGIEEKNAYLKDICDAAARASELTRQLLAFSSRQIMEPHPTSLNMLIQGLEKMLHRLVPEHIELRVSLDERLHTVMADPGQVEQVIINLVVNARDAMPDGGKLQLSTRNVTFEADYVAFNPWAQAGDFAEIEVSDNGTGIMPDVLDRIFEPYFSTKGEGKGTGLGLAVVFGIVKQLGGFLHVYSEPGMGAEFRIYFPSTGEVHRSPVHAPELASVSGSESILLVEDDAQVRALTRSMLISGGYLVTCAENGLVALALFQENQLAFDLVLVDMVMPKMGGREAASRILQLSPRTRILMCSGYSESGLHARPENGHDYRMIHKPFSKIELLATVRSVLDHPAG
ncbi:MAG: response regulator [Candidatus Hydrogenedentes bacterium]|nr:response regulator [Candidatus Hydrogenedentota bacterium]